ncbi:MAG: type II secretion system protein [Lentisphaeria bacterium]|nr:type II secretion system protein [Lentisphaeria bacterium]
MTTRRNRFTLIELLVVIGIIAVLAGMLLPALSAARNHARKTKAKTEMKALQTAMALYEGDYGVPPFLPDNFPALDWYAIGVGNDYVHLIEYLQGANPRGKRYLEVVSDQGPGEYLDPWRNRYWIVIDTDFDGQIDGDTTANPAGHTYDRNGDGTLDPIYEKVIIWSFGSDEEQDNGKPDDVNSWN